MEICSFLSKGSLSTVDVLSLPFGLAAGFIIRALDLWSFDVMPADTKSPPAPRGVRDDRQARTRRRGQNITTTTAPKPTILPGEGIVDTSEVGGATKV